HHTAARPTCSGRLQSGKLRQEGTKVRREKKTDASNTAGQLQGKYELTTTDTRQLIQSLGATNRGIREMRRLFRKSEDGGPSCVGQLQGDGCRGQKVLRHGVYR
ncbi:MAG: hypothetical protein VXV86_06550, partial [Verrucomicrobiota bacterium]|nr:hypothetical protein [Verrucomicrobiota bacterium]